MFLKSGNKPGYRLLLTRWLLFDAAISLSLVFGLKVSGFEFAQKALFPAASILVGMAVAWTARAAVIINDGAFRKNFISNENPIECLCRN